MLPVKEKVLAQLTYFTEYCDEEVRLKAVSGLGKCSHTETARHRCVLFIIFHTAPYSVLQ